MFSASGMYVTPKDRTAEHVFQQGAGEASDYLGRGGGPATLSKVRGRDCGAGPPTEYGLGPRKGGYGP